MFRAAHLSSGTLNYICNLWFIEYFLRCNRMLEVNSWIRRKGYINQKIEIQFRAPDDERCNARYMLSLISTDSYYDARIQEY